MWITFRCELFHSEKSELAAMVRTKEMQTKVGRRMADSRSADGPEAHGYRDNPAFEAYLASRMGSREAPIFLPQLRPEMRLLWAVITGAFCWKPVRPGGGKCLCGECGVVGSLGGQEAS